MRARGLFFVFLLLFPLLTNSSSDNLESFIHLNNSTYSFAIIKEQNKIETSLGLLNNSKFNLTSNIILCSLNMEIKKDKLSVSLPSLIARFDGLIEDMLNNEYMKELMLHDLYSIKIIEIEMIRFEDGEFYHLTILISIVGERLQNTNILSNERRRKIFEYIQSNPGAYLREIMRENCLSPNWTKYHLNVLEIYGYIKSKRCGRNIVYFPADKKKLMTMLSKHTSFYRTRQ